MKRHLSRYHRRYPRSLTYMLQASEYLVPEYIAWTRRTPDFSKVEKRGQLNLTAKARALLITAWLLAAAYVFAATTVVIHAPNLAISIVEAGVALVIGPILLAYAVILPVLLVAAIQKPLERQVIARASQKLASHPGIRIGIAGSYGKTSMRELLKTILAEGKRVAAPPHSYNTPLGISSFINGLSGDEEVLLFELGEYYPGDVRRLCQFVQPQIGVITGVNEAHLEKFKRLDRTVATIFELADWLPEGPVYVNGESETAAEAARKGHILYSHEGAGELKVSKASTNLEGTQFTLGTLALESGLLGLHQVGPLAAATHIAKRLGLSDEQVAAGVAKTQPFAHRLHPHTDASGVITLDDSYNGNPDGVRAVITFLGGLKGRRFYVTPGLVEMGSRSREVHREIGRQLAEAGIEKAVLVRNSVTPYIEEGLTEANYRGEILWFDEGLQALAALPHLTAAGDIVLIQNDWPDQYS